MESQEVLLLAKRLVPDTSSRVEYLKDGGTKDIIKAIKLCLPSSVRQTAEFSQALLSACHNDKGEMLRTLYSFLVDRVPLVIDPLGVQNIKKPSVLVHASELGADCKSYSLFISSVLSNVGIPHRFKFVSWREGDEVRHVFIEAFLSDKRIVLDCNMKKFDAEKLPNYNNTYIDMTRISAIGDVPKKQEIKKIKKGSLFNGRPMNRMSDIEIEIRLIRQGLQNERDSIQRIAGIGSDDPVIVQYDGAIGMTNDLICEIANLVDTGDYVNSDSRIAGIGYDFATGAYGVSAIGDAFQPIVYTEGEGIGAFRKNRKAKAHLAPDAPARARMRRRRLARIEKGNAPTLDDVEKENAHIGKVFKKIAKAVKKAAKTVAKTVAKTTKKVVKATAKAVAKATTTVAKGVATAVVATATAGQAKKTIKKLAKSTAKDAKAFAKANKDLVTAPVGALAEVLLEEWCPQIGPFFQNAYLSDADAKKYLNAKGQQRRNKAKKLRSLLIKHLNVDSKKFDKAIKNSIQKQTGKTLEANLQNLKNIAEGKPAIAAIGMAPGMVSAIMSAVMALLALLLKRFAGKDAAAEFSALALTTADAANDSEDWVNNLMTSASNGVTKLVNTASNIKNNVLATASNIKDNLVNQASNLVESASNLTNLQMLTGSALSPLVQSSGSDADAMNTTTSPDVDAITNREVSPSGEAQGASAALNTVASSMAEDTKDDAQPKSDNKTMLYIAGAVAAVGAVLMLKK